MHFTRLRKNLGWMQRMYHFSYTMIKKTVLFLVIIMGTHPIVAEDRTFSGIEKSTDILLVARVKKARHYANKATLLNGKGRGIFKDLNLKKSGLDFYQVVRGIKAITLAYKQTLLILSSNNQVPNTFKTNF